MVLQNFFHFLIHIDSYLLAFVSSYGLWTYLILFAIIFSETAFVVTPFLPGDALLFSAGSVAAQPGQPLSIVLLLLLLILASTLGNQINYWIGKKLGPKVFKSDGSRLFNKRYLDETERFYEKHGPKTIILARYIPIIRTFAPFVAGIGSMQALRFFLYNLGSAILWIVSLTGAGYLFGGLPIVKNNFTLVIYGIVLLSIMPGILSVLMRFYKNCGD